tara:strand:+ start:145 stop:891 length:747 start_codon:yes stop_codon:yes gene_type:complete
MPAYNAAVTLPDSIASIQAQTETSWELLLVVDRNSTDETLAIAQTHASEDHRIRLFGELPEGGCVFNRNHALREATGTFVAFLDSDDLWMPEKLRLQSKLMTDATCDFSCTGYRQISREGHELPIVIRPPDRITYDALLKDNVIGCLTVMYRRSRFPDLRFVEFLHEDYILWLQMLRQTNACGLPDCLASYRVTASSRSGNKVKAAIARWHILRKFEKLPLPVALSAFLSYAAVAVMRRRLRSTSISS